jgi:FtsP/CotA-like multicopper oxidase with cupredoxin domain
VIQLQSKRRNFLKSLGALGLGALPRVALPEDAATNDAPTQGDFCGTGANGQALFIPGARGMFGRLVPDGARLRLRAGTLAGKPDKLAYLVEHSGRQFINPTLVLRRGERVRIDFDNSLTEPTIVHWHGLAVDTRNDGAGMSLAEPGKRYSYDFEVRNRGALYWYHPHPHGMTAAQAYRGLFGMIEVEDEDERRLRAALDLAPGATEIPLVLQDRRGDGYAASDADRMHGFLGDAVYINGTACPHLDVATRIYRFRVLNASNARTYRLGLRTADGKSVPFTLIGTDGGLLPAPVRCEEAFVASAERIDMLVDLTDASIGDTLVLETRAFDPMHLEMGATAGTPSTMVDHAAMGHATPVTGTTAGAPPIDHAATGHGGSFPEGAQRALLQLRVRKRIAYAGPVPQQLTQIAAIDIADAPERPLRLGFAKGRWRINDRVFAMGETPIEAKRDTVETWLIRNYFNSMPHAMHLHGFNFEVLERQTSPDPIAALRVDDRGRLATDLGRKDTVLVWPGESVKIALDFACPFPGTQTYMFHCHNLEHEDGMMMRNFSVL